MEEDRASLLKVLEWIRGKDDNVSRFAGHPEERSKWYIVSLKWLKKWKKLNKLDEEMSGDDMEEDLGKIDSQDLILADESHHIKANGCVLRSDIRHGTDYEFLPPKAWEFLKAKYGSEQEIIRKSISTRNCQTQIEVTLTKVKFIVIVDKQLKTLKPHYFHFSRKKKLDKVIRALKEFAKSLLTRPDFPNTKIWKLDVEEVLEKVQVSQSVGSSAEPMDSNDNNETPEEKIERAITKLSQYIANYQRDALIFPGSLVSSSYERLEDLDLTEADLYVIDVKSGYNSLDLFKEKNKVMCEYCRKTVTEARMCYCKKYYYCNDSCEDRDHNYHCCKKKVFVRSDYSKLGKVGLQNLGNTCYMNSGLQCLSNTKPLTEFILTEQYLKDINHNNILGSKGVLVEEFAQLIKEMWLGVSSQVSPWGVKKAFGEFAKQFLGYFQQDSQEMLGYLIDGIHEDLNRIEKKPYLEDPSGEGISEKELSEKFWQNHKQRNDSIIVDLMHGQYRSEVECPDCRNISITFDPFLMITLPIPEKDQKNYEFVLVKFDETIRGKVNAPKGSNSGTIRDKVCEMLNVSNDSIEMAELSMNTIKGILKGNEKVTKRTTLILYKKNVSEISENNDYTTVFIDFRKKSYGYSGQVIGNPYLFTVRKNISMQDLYKEIHIFYLGLKKAKPEDEEEAFRKDFPSYFTSSYAENLFSLKIHNPYQYPCCICDRISCPGCPIQYEKKSFAHYLERCKESNVRISISLSEKTYDYSFISSVTDHDSYFASSGNSNLNEKVDLEECFDLFGRKEQLDQDNTIYCSKCKDHKRGFKKMGVSRLPEVLIVHLKRFKQKKYHTSKNNKVVEFPIEGLKMANCFGDEQVFYDLYAVSNHFGSLEGGHYTAFAKGQDGVWRDFDDSSVRAMGADDIVSSSAYVLFYQKRRVL